MQCEQQSTESVSFALSSLSLPRSPLRRHKMAETTSHRMGEGYR